MTDREFLIWIHQRLVSHGDKPLIGFMHRLREIIHATPKDQHITGKVATMVSMDVLREIEKSL